MATQRRATVYAQATRDYAGVRVEARRSILRDEVRLPGPPCPAVIRHYYHYLNGRRRDYTEFAADISWSGGAMRVSTPEWSAALNRYYGGFDLTIGAPEFDRRFVIQSNPVELGRTFLDEGTTRAIGALDMLGEGPFLFQVRPGQALIRVSRHMQEGPMLRLFIEHCYTLVHRLLGHASSREVRIEAVTLGADARCQVCGTPIEADRRVLCRTCRTPHHGDCWAYNDGCSIFACGERRSVRA